MKTNSNALCKKMKKMKMERPEMQFLADTSGCQPTERRLSLSPGLTWVFEFHGVPTIDFLRVLEDGSARITVNTMGNGKACVSRCL